MSEHARNVAKISVASGVATLSQIAKGKMGAVLLGTEGVGILSQLKYAWNLLQFLFGVGFYNGLVRHIAEADAQQDNERIQSQVSTLLIVIAFVACGGTLVALLASPLISNFLFSGDSTKAPLVMVTMLAVPMAVLARMYKGILSAYRDVRSIVISQIIADVFSVFLFAALVFPLGVTGAVISFALYHVVRAVLNVGLACRHHGAQQVIPNLKRFQASVIKENLSFSIVALIIMPVSILTTIMVSRWIIASLGLDENGVFAAAWTVSTVYLRVLYESASSYYLPVMSTAADSAELGEHMDGALALYLIGIPPVVVGLVTLGEIVISVLFSRDFAAAGKLLIWLLPADLLRIVSETVGLSMVASARLRPYLLAYLAWAGLYLALASVWIDSYGLLGACYAYAVSHSVYVCLQLILVSKLFQYRPSPRTRWIILRGVALAVIASLLVSLFPSVLARCLIMVVVIGAWFIFSRREPEFASLSAKIRRRFGLSA